MNRLFTHEALRLEWGVATRNSPGQEISGDLHLVAPFPGGALVAVVDGLGHGDAAAAVARVACETLGAHATEAVVPLVERCHAALRATRGVVMTLVSFNFDEHTATAVGVGNVETILVRADPDAEPAREAVLLRGGIVGDRLPPMQADAFALRPGDLVLFGTDGVSEGFWEDADPTDPLEPLVNELCARHFRGGDDALVLAVRYLGNSGDDR